jgi:putative ABC transport system permease protein
MADFRGSLHSIQGVIVLLTRDFVRLILLANLVAYPLGWFLMTNWLKDFAYRINLSWYVFVLSSSMALVIGLITISLQEMKATMANPIISLKSE